MRIKPRLKNLLLIVFLAIVSCKKQDPPGIPRDGLVAKILLDGNAFDEINQIQATNHNAVSTADHRGTANHALYFNRNDSAYLDFNDNPNYSFPDNIFTISCWILVNDTSQPITILSKRNITAPFEYSWDNHMNKSDFSFDNWIASGSTTVYGVDPLKATIPISKGQWQHVAIVANGLVLKAYLNGVQTGEVDSLKNGNTFTDTNASLQVGLGGGYGKNYYFSGSIDDILIYKRALTADEIEIIASL